MDIIKLKANPDGSHQAVTWDMYGGMIEFPLDKFKDAVTAMFAERKKLMPLHEQQTREAAAQVEQANAAKRAAEAEAAQKDVVIAEKVAEITDIKTVISGAVDLMKFGSMTPEQFDAIKPFIKPYVPNVDSNSGDVRIDEGVAYIAIQDQPATDKTPKEIATSWERIIPGKDLAVPYAATDLDTYVVGTIVETKGEYWMSKVDRPKAGPAATNDEWKKL